MYVSFTYGGNKKRKKILELKNGIVATLWKLAELKSRNAYSYSRTGTIKNIIPNTSFDHWGDSTDLPLTIKSIKYGRHIGTHILPL
jgi:plasmid replication initiation protein